MEGTAPKWRADAIFRKPALPAFSRLHARETTAIIRSLNFIRKQTIYSKELRLEPGTFDPALYLE